MAPGVQQSWEKRNFPPTSVSARQENWDEHQRRGNSYWIVTHARGCLQLVTQVDSLNALKHCLNVDTMITTLPEEMGTLRPRVDLTCTEKCCGHQRSWNPIRTAWFWNYTVQIGAWTHCPGIGCTWCWLIKFRFSCRVPERIQGETNWEVTSGFS